MQLYSTNNPSLRVGLQEAIFKGLPEDNGLYMPLEIPKLPKQFIDALPHLSFQEIAVTVARSLMQDVISSTDIRSIVEEAINFPAPVIRLDGFTYVLELFHGPSLAFKDFGARFMAGLMSYYNRGADQDLTILVATSGDTGGAVAAGFYKTPGIKVIILYPSGKVSPLQEKQLTTLGHNIKAVEVLGSFDECQSLVKQCFLDLDLRSRIRLSSANSINISRLIPQSFYYFEAYKQIVDINLPVVFSVPSGNFGNLTAGLLSKRMGLPVHHFIAATNANDVVPSYLNSGKFSPRKSVRTLSNAMDVGNPSNFARMIDLCSTWNTMKSEISGQGVSDEETRKSMLEIFRQYGYIMDPHGSVAYKAWQKYQERIFIPVAGIVLETAHPAKFLEDVEGVLKTRIELPERLSSLVNKQKESVTLSSDYSTFKEWLLYT